MTAVGFLWQFTYDQNGMRTSRTNGNRVYNYVYNGSSLRQVTVDDHDLNFTYDASGRPLTLIYDGTAYWYDLNLQGDVVGILDSYGNTVVSYTYNAWGCILSITGSEKDTVGFYNPLRYRGYVYDTETGLYYLQSRYYDPEICRFLNADAFTSTGQGLLGNNMFAYCLSNPINFVDSRGYKPSFLKFSEIWDGSGQPNQKEVDITDKLNGFMQENSETLQQYYQENGFVKAALYFYENVKDGGDLDIKLQEDWKFEEDTIYYYNGAELRYDDPGNINFGYVGAVLFPESILCLGAGLNQISKYGFMFGSLSTFYDDPRDNEMIKLGFSIYWEDHK